jgi:hypothetical protein
LGTIDPILSLALSMHANPGVYAILVGSGVSRAAKIPTGWEVVLDLIRKLATLEGEDCDPDPAAWYHDKYGKDADYSDLLNEIGKSPTERQQLLRSYFEPTEEDREQGLKQPTRAHQAIAKLVAGGICRVILTTNFDELLERAIQDEGISPSVISTPDAAEGALPLPHQKHCIVKLHGDYLDSRIKNTPAELQDYDPRLNALLDQILDQFGLIVCGWSAQWDTALRAAFERCKTRRFTTFWATRRAPVNEAQKLIGVRNAEVVIIEDADEFFARLHDLVSALNESHKPHPTSRETAVALVKRYIAEPRYRIKLEDLLANETEITRLRIETLDEELLPSHPSFNNVFQRYRDAIEQLQAMMIHGIAQGSEAQDLLWLNSLQRVAADSESTRMKRARAIRQYPVLVLIYACGLAALSKKRVAFFVSLLCELRVRLRGQYRPLLPELRTGEISRHVKTIPRYSMHSAAMGEHVHDVLREPLRRFVPDDVSFDEIFDYFDYMHTLIRIDMVYDDFGSVKEIPVPEGRYSWRIRDGESTIIQTVDDEIAEAGQDWVPLKLGAFRGDLTRLREIKARVDTCARQFRPF